MKPTIALILILSFFHLNAQQRKIDSLETVLKTSANDTSKVNLLNVICRNLQVESSLARAMDYANQALLLSEKLQFKKGSAEAFNNIGLVYKDQGDYPGSIKNHLASLKRYEEIGYLPGIASVHINLGNIYFLQGNYAEGLQSNLVALKISNRIGNKRNIASTYINIGNVYFKQENYPDALKSYSDALKLEKEIGDKQAMASCYGNIGNFYFQQNNYAEALKNYQLTLKLSEEVGNKQSVGTAYNNIGNIYFQQQNYPEALKNHLASLKIREEIGDKLGAVFSYMNLGELYVTIKNQTLAREYLNKALLLSKEIGSKETTQNCYYFLSEIDSTNGDYKKAFENFRLYAEMKDSLFNENSDKKISQLKIEFESDKKDAQIKTQNLKLQNQALQHNILKTRIIYGTLIGLILIGIIVILFYLRNRRKRKEYENMLVNLELTALRSQLNPHFIFNALNSIKAYIDSNPKTGSEYLTRFSLLMRGVLEGSEEKEISLGEEMQLMAHYIELEKLRLHNGLTYSITYDVAINKEDIMIPPLITQPVIENAVWHGLASLDKPGELYIHSSLSNNTLLITIRNSAENFQEQSVNSPSKKSFGMKITRERLALLKQTTSKEGSVTLEKLPLETKATITIPLN